MKGQKQHQQQPEHEENGFVNHTKFHIPFLELTSLRKYANKI